MKNVFIVRNRGFTLLELLVVMAILGILAVVVFVGINPAQRQAQARDTGRISAIAQMGRALQAYYTAHAASYPGEATWAQDLLDTGELSSFPSGIKYTNPASQCTQFVQPGVDPTFCYRLDATNGALVYATAEAQNKLEKCPGSTPYFIFSTADSRGGTICASSEPIPWASGTQIYVD
jgi:prepilin-type N-terminal cleavage/methylation domain-containing protein